eukprot:PhM_4_TR13909/c0_g1_i4/m.49458
MSCRDCAVLRQQNQQLQRKLSTSQQLYKDCTAKLETSDRYVKKLEARLSLGGFAEQCKKLEMKLATYQRRMNDDADRIQSLEDAVRAHDVMAEQLRTSLCMRADELGSSPSKLAELGREKHEHASLQHEMVSLRSELSNAHQTIKGLEDKYHSLEAELEASKNVNETAMDGLQEVQGHVDELSAERQDLLKELEEAYEQLSEKESLGEQLQKALLEAQHHHTCWSFAEKQKSEEKEKRIALETRLEELDVWTKNVERREADYKEQIAVLKTKLAGTEDALREAQERSKILSTDVSTRSHDYDSRIKQLTEDITMRTDRVHSLEREVAGLKNELGMTKSKLQEAQAHAHTLQNTLGGSLAALQGKESAMADELTVAKEEVRRLTLENKKLNLLQDHYKKLIARAVAQRNDQQLPAARAPRVAFASTEPPPRTPPREMPGMATSTSATNVSLSPYTPTPKRNSLLRSLMVEDEERHRQQQYPHYNVTPDVSGASIEQSDAAAARRVTLSEIASWTD